MKKVASILFKACAILYVLVCILLYFFQEKMIFAPEKLCALHSFHFNTDFQEMNIQTSDSESLNGLLFKADSSKGLIFYLHGNGGCVDSWGEISKVYTDLHYDLFMLDYRGYGIIILGYSIGTGLATKLASDNKPKHLILQAPYYSLTDMMKDRYPIIPTFLLKYKLATDEFIRKCKMPITIFHGDKDEVISHKSSFRLKELMKPTDELIILRGAGHNGMSDNTEYLKILKLLLEK